MIPFMPVSRMMQFETQTRSMLSTASGPTRIAAQSELRMQLVIDDVPAGSSPRSIVFKAMLSSPLWMLQLEMKTSSTAVDVDAVAVGLDPAIDPQALDAHLPAVDGVNAKRRRVLHEKTRRAARRGNRAVGSRRAAGSLSPLRNALPWPSIVPSPVIAMCSQPSAKSSDWLSSL